MFFSFLTKIRNMTAPSYPPTQYQFYLQLLSGPQKLSEIDARLLVTYGLGIDTLTLITDRSTLLTQAKKNYLEELVRRRLAGEPVSRIMGKRAFWNHDFRVTPHVLDPRPESEILIEATLEVLAPHHRLIIDLGTGSGCLLLSLMQECAKRGISITGVGVDLSPQALYVAQSQTIEPGEGRIYFVASDWLCAFMQKPFIDVVVSNPPYIPTQNIASLEREVKDWDPFQALDGGKDGLQAYRALMASLRGRLRPNGYVVLECGKNQHTAIEDLLVNSGLTPIGCRDDLSGTTRVVIAQNL